MGKFVDSVSHFSSVPQESPHPSLNMPPDLHGTTTGDGEGEGGEGIQLR